MIRAATEDDVPAVLELLASEGLPTEGVEEHLDGFVVVEDGGSIVGVGGLEIHPGAALLRSLAVAADRRGRGLATRICDRLEADARRRGAPSVYLLTETAERFFARRGYAKTDRGEAPEGIARSAEFVRLCPASAAFLRRTL